MIVRWVDTGAPLGDVNDLPPPVEWPDPEAWQLADRFGPPDLIVRSDPHSMPASGQDRWWRPVVETGLTEPRWVRAIEIKPSFPGRKIVHHVLASLVQEEDEVTRLATSFEGTTPGAGLFMEWAIGKVGEIFPDDAGKLMLPGSKIPLGGSLSRHRAGSSKTTLSRWGSTSTRKVKSRGTVRS